MLAVKALINPLDYHKESEIALVFMATKYC